jgi:hypothetical protein
MFWLAHLVTKLKTLAQAQRGGRCKLKVKW